MNFYHPPPTRNQALAVYIEDENSDTGYSKSNSTQFPTDGFILNIEKSICTNGGNISQNSNSKKISLKISHNDMCSLYFDKELELGTSTTLAKLGKTIKIGSPNFAEPATTDETADGLYALADDYGTSYYYRGAVEDNYVKFAGYYWRIIRINGDGSIRIIYDGTSAFGNGVNSTNRIVLRGHKYNSNYNDAKYVGYMYGPSGTGASTSKDEAQTNLVNSDIKTAVENWYKTNIADKEFDSYVSDNIFCNDRAIPGQNMTMWTNDTGLGYGSNVTGYGALSRMMTGNNNTHLSAKENPIPKFTCTEKNDAFTKEDTEKGNGKLEQKVGMITVDEILAAGSGKYNTTNGNYYLYKGNWYWSLSPSNYSGSGAYLFRVNNDGALSYYYVYNMGGVAPVINLNAKFVSTMSGNGTMYSPFEGK